MNSFFKTVSVWTIALALVGASLCPANSQGKIAKRLPPHEYGTTLMNNYSEQSQMAPVVFRHWVHRSKHTCRLCHVDIGFAMEAGQTLVREKDNRDGQYCGVCHNGKEAFACEGKSLLGKAEKNCDRCHTTTPIGRDDDIRDDFDRMAEKLPEGRFGNRVDWAMASRQNMVKPKDFIAGVSFPRTKMKHQQGDVSLDAKLAGLPDIIFSHEEHATWNSCDLCHPEVFALKAGATKYTMQDIFAGRYCGACHGNVAFPLKDCGRCHSKPVF
ncbi:c(7)-type cytochrome triheme domain-containing protein [Desulfuromonas sp.]|uniref:c(7)-type cytochrome triheme domain-containing protein n=1 Tax=Desulfuromonas sp. TaxID=892 RepID=UPI0025C3A6F1|nr:c(7)-type cytochrome triheme domain-containing protein [Desulfuromonas sp.]